ncbi:MAG: hypothetical protein WCJ30_22690 [Deltaproteobacteria bacterium]
MTPQEIRERLGEEGRTLLRSDPVADPIARNAIVDRIITLAMAGGIDNPRTLAILRWLSNGALTPALPRGPR